MCGRFYVASEDMSLPLARIIAEINRKKVPAGLKTSGEICPTDIVPVLANNRQHEVKPFAMRWGYSLSAGNLVINARSETAALKPLFRDGIAHRRCLIPATAYFEWERQSQAKIKYALRPRNSPLLYLAGVYRLEPRQARLEPAFVVLTRQAAPDIAFIHDRMPVILPDAMHADWLDCRKSADEVLQTACLDMTYQPA